MRNPSKLAAFLVAGSSLSLLLATSAFADERHRDETRGSARSESRDHQQRGSDRGQSRDSNRGQSRDFNRGQSRDFNRGGSNRSAEPAPSRTFRDSSRDFSRNENRGQANRDFARNDSRWNNGGFNNGGDRRGDFRSESRDFRGEGSRGFREPFRNGVVRGDGRISTLGRVSRFEHERGGYRVWFGGGFPYWVPDSYFIGRHIGIGLDLRLGGIFRNGAVYVDALGYPGDPYYTDPYYYDSYNTGYAGGYDSSYVTGVVDRVDFRTGTVWLRDSRSGRIISVDMRQIDPRSSRVNFDDLRPGDRLSLNGAWGRDGVFLAGRIDGVDTY
jgi:hypothetical protein